jgi:hypothetical protein
MGGKPLSREIINERLLERGIVMLDEYERQYIPARFQCPKGHIWKARPNNILSGKGCPICWKSTMSARLRLPEEDIRQRLAEKGITLVGKYDGTQAKTSFQCEQGHVWETTPTAVLSRTGCPECAGNKPLTKKAINERIADRNITLIGEYHGAHASTLFQCSEGHSWLARPNNILNGRNCPHCAQQFPLTKEVVNERIKHRGIVLVGEYTTSIARTTFECGEGHTWEASPGNVMAGTGCMICAGTTPHTTQTINARIAGRGIRLIGEYVNNHTKVRFECDEGHVWETAPAGPLSGRGCPTCAERYSDSDVFYVWLAGPQDHVQLDNGELLLKYGVTSERRDNLRMKEVGWAWGMTTNLIAMVKTTASALWAEKRAQKIGRRLSSDLSHLEGWTEFRLVTEPEVAQFMAIADEAAEYRIAWNNPVPYIAEYPDDQLTLNFDSR